MKCWPLWFLLIPVLGAASYVTAKDPDGGDHGFSNTMAAVLGVGAVIAAGFLIWAIQMNIAAITPKGG
ncbi:MAG: hypothetical protein KBC06_02415 [Candidatus Pacebacteria bacterium]|nr:hypothetical protein [Candidatus Paceibacterota bacterium]